MALTPGVSRHSQTHTHLYLLPTVRVTNAPLIYFKSHPRRNADQNSLLTHKIYGWSGTPKLHVWHSFCSGVMALASHAGVEGFLKFLGDDVYYTPIADRPARGDNGVMPVLTNDTD